MLKELKFCICILFMVLSLNLHEYSFSEEKIEFSILSNKNEIAQFEPLVINFQLKNIGSTEWEIIGLMNYNTGWIKLEIGEYAGKYYRYNTGIHILMDEDKNRLKPGQLLASQVILNTYKKSLLEPPYTIEKIESDPHILFPFGEPGTYKIRAFYPLEPYIEERTAGRKRKMLESNVLEIKVHPFTDKERTQFNFFKNFSYFWAAIGGLADINYDELIKQCEAFIALYPDSVYTPYIELALARRYFSGVYSNKPNYVRSYEILSKLITHCDALLCDDALIYLAETQVELSRLKEAKETLDRLIKDYPISDNVLDAKRIREGLEKGYTNLNDILEKIVPPIAIDAK